MALIEGFRVQNYRALRDVTLGKLSNQQGVKALTSFAALICSDKDYFISCNYGCGIRSLIGAAE
jgi:hypothetical protein